MSSRAELRARGQLIDELHQIVQAMKNVAYAELQRIAREQPAAEEAAGALRDARSQLGTWPEAVSPAAPAAWLVIGAERGFCGPLNARLAEATAAQPGGTVFAAGQRLAESLSGRAGLVVLPGCAGIDEVDASVQAWLETLAGAEQPLRTLRLRLMTAGGVADRPLLDDTGPDGPGIAGRPATWLRPEALHAALQRQSAQTALRLSLLEALGQENRQRLTQMQQAQDHLDRLRVALGRRLAAQHQADITTELETLISAMDGQRALSRRA